MDIANKNNDQNDSQVVLWDSAFEGESLWFARCGDCNVAVVQDFLHEMFAEAGACACDVEDAHVLIYCPS